MSFGAGQVKQACLARPVRIGLVQDLAAAPYCRRLQRQVLNGPDCAFIGPEIPRPRKLHGIARKRDGKLEVAAKRIENMLPRPGRIRVAQNNWPARFERRNRVRYDTVSRAIATAEYIASPRAGSAEPPAFR